MHTTESLIDLHERTHRCVVKLLDHCEAFSQQELSREFEGFGGGSIRDQLHHMIGAQEYWIGVIHGRSSTDDNDADLASIDALRAFRLRVFDVTAAYLAETSESALNTRRTMVTWGNKQADLTPAHVVLRTQTHIFQHQGQVAAMARLLGRPIPPGLDFPLL